MRSSVSPYVTTPHPSIAVGSSPGGKLDRGGDLGAHQLLAGMRGEPVAARGPAALAAEQQHPGVLPRAVVLERGGLRPAFEILLGRVGLLEQAPDRLELIGAMEVRRTGDRDLAFVEVRPGANDGQRLDRLRGAPEEREQRGIAGGELDATVPHRDCVNRMPRLDDAASGRLDHDRAHRRQPMAGMFSCE
jgi:hypothetical protein